MWGFLCRRQCLVPTWRGWLALLAAAAVLVVLAVQGAYSFLAVTEPVPGGTLVVEGWAPDYALAEALAELRRNPYLDLFVTGGPLERGAPLSEYKTYAELGAATLARMGASTNAIQPVPAPLVRQDRTYTSAVALKHWLREHGTAVTNFNVISVGPHARRTRLLYQKALGGRVNVGIIAVADRDYDASRWWTSSLGVRAVTGEWVAYGYARLWFRPPEE